MYMVGAGFFAVSLVVIDPQPTSQGVRPTRRTFAGDGAIYEEAYYVELEFNILGNAIMYQSVLTQFGLLSSLTATVTVMCRDANSYVFATYNGLAIRPEMGKDTQWNNFFPRNMVILIKDLDQLI